MDTIHEYTYMYVCICVHVTMLASPYKSSLCFPVYVLRMYVYCARSTNFQPLCPWVSEWGDDDTTCAVCAWTMLADSDMSPVYILPLVLCYLQARHTLRDWRKLGKCQKVIQHRPRGGVYAGVAVKSESLLAVTDNENTHANRCVHIFNKAGTLVRSIGKGVLSGDLHGITFDLKGNVWVTDTASNKVRKLSQDGQLLQTINHAGSKSDHFSRPDGLSVSPEGLIYICDRGNHRVTVHDEEGMFLLAFGSNGSGPGCFDRPCDVTFGSDGLVYVTDRGNDKVCVWSKEGSFQRDFKTKHAPAYIAATGDNHLLITSWDSDIVMVYTLGGQLVHEFGGNGTDMGKFCFPYGICVDDSGTVYVADCENLRVQVF